MAYHDLLVHLDESRNCPVRLAAAGTLAHTLSACLTGLYVMPPPDLPANINPYYPPEVRRAAREAVRKKAQHLQERFDQARDTLQFTADWRCVTGEPGHQVNYHARFHDLVIIGQTDPDDPHAIGAGFVSDVVLGAGRPVLVIPYIGPRPTLGRHVLVAWDGSREAARAVHDALPLLALAERVLILTLSGEGGTEAKSSGAEIGGRLVQRGITAILQDLPPDTVDVGDLLLDRAAEENFDLIVTGAYGHTRLREIVLGGTTRQLLNQMTVPVLLSH